MTANRAVDEYAIKTCGIPGHTLMQNAGDAAVEQLHQKGYLRHSPDVLILAGHGNNGGDGFVIAAGLSKQGVAVSIITTAPPDRLTPDARWHFDQLEELGIRPQQWLGTESQHQQIQEADIIVDALLGTGISGEIRPPYDTLINLSNQSSARCVAIDVPSGITGDLGEILEPCIQAEITVSMGFGKQGSLFEPARSCAGTVIPVDIGFPKDSLEQIDGDILWKNESSDYPFSQFCRPGQTHKYTAGKVFIIAGSQGFSGAAILASTAALRAGAGLVRLAIPQSLGAIAECTSLETVVDYVAETPTQGIAFSALPELQRGCEWADTVVIGPGLGRHPETIRIVQEVIKGAQQPLVIDADALYALSEDPRILGDRSVPTIITPHAGEFKRLIGEEGDTVPTWQDARTFACEYGVSVLLKGAPSLIASPRGEILVNSTGYAGMATAGTGDVLSGAMGALIAQWGEDAQTPGFAMYIHGKAAELQREKKGVLGLISSDIVEALPETLKEYGGLPR